MHILVMRHGQAENFARSDEHRKLTASGTIDAASAGRTLKHLNIEFDECWISPYVRAQETGRQVLQSVNVPKIETKEILTPDSSPRELVSFIESTDVERILIVSHQPLVSRLVAMLKGSDVRYQPPMMPASMAFLTADTLLQGCCHLEWLRHAPTFEATIE